MRVVAVKMRATVMVTAREKRISQHLRTVVKKVESYAVKGPQVTVSHWANEWPKCYFLRVFNIFLYCIHVKQS